MSPKSCSGIGLCLVSDFIYRIVTEEPESPVLRSLWHAGVLELAIKAIRCISSPKIARRVPEIDRPCYACGVERLHEFIIWTVVPAGRIALVKAIRHEWRARILPPFIFALIAQFLKSFLINILTISFILSGFVRYTNQALATDAKAFDLTNLDRRVGVPGGRVEESL
ncbi:hypothetical protein GYMLUDRAFT_239122 [Collybiopsis luxurians FD-317 M1]|nr:hypothetical protein GYMLUDRAFT_239122 [Collybiopsis luxurians FD-317 M1]